jgi:hypothetical protein
MTRTKPTNFSAGSNDEMCMVFLTYYPLLPNNWIGCGLLSNRTVCGNGKNILNIANPTIRDPTGGEQIDFGQEPYQCSVGHIQQDSAESHMILLGWLISLTFLATLVGAAIVYKKRKTIMDWIKQRKDQHSGNHNYTELEKFNETGDGTDI